MEQQERGSWRVSHPYRLRIPYASDTTIGRPPGASLLVSFSKTCAAQLGSAISLVSGGVISVPAGTALAPAPTFGPA